MSKITERERVLLSFGYNTNFTCDFHRKYTEKNATRIVVNIFYNNEQKNVNESKKTTNKLI